jgi:imidazolonepropionase-like amidohydrolase
MPALRTLTLSLLCLFPFGAAHALDHGNAVVTAARMLDVRSGRMLHDVSVQIEDGRIKQVVQGAGNSAVMTDRPHYDLGDMTLLPGMIDMHVHLDSDPGYGGYTGLQFGDRFWSVLTVPHALKTLQAGFTTVRNVGSDAWNDIGLRQAIDAGKIEGPRVVTAAYSFGATGVMPYWTIQRNCFALSPCG